MGRAGRVVGTYEKPVARTSLIIVYQATDEILHIVRIIHAKRNWPEGEWPGEPLLDSEIDDGFQEEGSVPFSSVSFLKGNVPISSSPHFLQNAGNDNWPNFWETA
jgi:hypothetical protein